MTTHHDINETATALGIKPFYAPIFICILYLSHLTLGYFTPQVQADWIFVADLVAKYSTGGVFAITFFKFAIPYWKGRRIKKKK